MPSSPPTDNKGTAMLRLDTTTRKLQIVLGAAVAANQLPVVVSYSDKSASSYVGSTQRSLTNGATAVDICAAPAASTIRDIDMLTVVNTDTADAAVKLLLDDNGTDAELFTVTLAPGSQINYTHGQGFKVIDKNGAPQADRQVFQLVAGAAIAEDDAVEIGPEGKAYPVNVTDYAAVTNCNYGTAQTSTATGRIVAQTEIFSGYYLNQNAANEKQLVQGDNGDIFMLTPRSASNDVVLRRYSAGGALLGSVIVNTDAANAYYAQIVKTANGNLVVAFSNSTGLRYAVFTQILVTVKAITTIEALYSYSSSVFDITTLTAGGFAVVYQPSAGSGLDTSMATFDNSGTAVVAPTVIWTRTGSVGSPMYKIEQLSNGNIAILAHTLNVSSGSFMGQWHAIYTTAVMQVMAFTGIDTAAEAQYEVHLKVSGDYYAVCYRRGDNSTYYVVVFSNSGVQQGTVYSRSDAGIYTMHMAAGDACFWFISSRNSDSKMLLAKIPVTGGAGATVADVTTTGTSNCQSKMKIFVEGDYIVAVAKPTTNNYLILFVMSATTGALVNAASTAIGASWTGVGTGIYLVPGGDFSFIALYEFTTTAGTYFCVGKYANTSVVGVAAAAAAQGDPVSIKQGAGTYVCNTLKGTSSVAFDHTSGANIYGNKGALLTNGVVLRGM